MGFALAEVTMNLVRAWECSIAGFAASGPARRYATRFQAGPLEAVRFAAGELSGTPFEEFFARACDPATALAAIAAHQPLPRHYLTVLEDQPGLREAYERAGYRLDDTETLMACELATIQLPDLDAGVAQVQTTMQADWYNANDPQGIRWVLADNLADPRMSHYAIVRGGQLVARGRNLQLDAEHSYVSRIYVAEAWRGQGLARALMARLLADDIARGARWSVLTASRMGARLYAGLGYRSFGTILIFEPAKG